MDRRQHRRLDEAAVGQRQEVEAVVDHVELVGPLEDVRDVEALGHLRVDVRILRVPAGDDRREPARGHRVGGREERHVDAAGDQALGQERGELLPRAVVAWRHAPRDRRQHGHAQRRPFRRLPIRRRAAGSPRRRRSSRRRSWGSHRRRTAARGRVLRGGRRAARERTSQRPSPPPPLRRGTRARRSGPRARPLARTLPAGARGPRSGGAALPATPRRRRYGAGRRVAVRVGRAPSVRGVSRRGVGDPAVAPRSPDCPHERLANVYPPPASRSKRLPVALVAAGADREDERPFVHVDDRRQPPARAGGGSDVAQVADQRRAPMAQRQRGIAPSGRVHRLDPLEVHAVRVPVPGAALTGLGTSAPAARRLRSRDV